MDFLRHGRGAASRSRAARSCGSLRQGRAVPAHRVVDGIGEHRQVSRRAARAAAHHILPAYIVGRGADAVGRIRRRHRANLDQSRNHGRGVSGFCGSHRHRLFPQSPSEQAHGSSFARTGSRRCHTARTRIVAEAGGEGDCKLSQGRAADCSASRSFVPTPRARPGAQKLRRSEPPGLDSAPEV